MMNFTRFIFTAAFASLQITDAMAEAPLGFTGRQDDRECSVSIRARAEHANALYDHIYPEYFEVCGSSLLKSRKGDDGGNFGHAFAMMRGVESVRDSATGAVQLKRKPGATTGISTDAQYHNVQWTGTNGRDEMLYCGLKPDEALNAAKYEMLMERPFQKGQVLDGVQFKPWNVKDKLIKERQDKGLPPPTEQEIEAATKKWAGPFTIGTDWCMTAGRSIGCTRIPLMGKKDTQGRSPLDIVMNHFNELNQDANRYSKEPRPGKTVPTGYEYHVWTNNCTAAIDNAMAKIGALPPMDASQAGYDYISQALRYKDLGVPYNQMLGAFDKANKRGLGCEIGPDGIESRDCETDPKRVQAEAARFVSLVMTEIGRDTGPKCNGGSANCYSRAAFENNAWLVHQAGVILEDIPTHFYQNHYFDPVDDRQYFSLIELIHAQMAQLSKKAVGQPIFPRYDPSKKRHEAMIDPTHAPIRETDLVENFKYWRTRYRAVLEVPELKVAKPGSRQAQLKAHFEEKLKETEGHLAKAEAWLRSNPRPALKCRHLSTGGGNSPAKAIN